jgi:hypothetical protein
MGKTAEARKRVLNPREHEWACLSRFKIRLDVLILMFMIVETSTRLMHSSMVARLSPSPKYVPRRSAFAYVYVNCHEERACQQADAFADVARLGYEHHCPEI